MSKATQRRDDSTDSPTVETRTSRSATADRGGLHSQSECRTGHALDLYGPVTGAVRPRELSDDATKALTPVDNQTPLRRDDPVVTAMDRLLERLANDPDDSVRELRRYPRGMRPDSGNSNPFQHLVVEQGAIHSSEIERICHGIDGVSFGKTIVYPEKVSLRYERT